MSTLREHPEAGSAAAKLVNFHDRAVLDGAGDVFDWAGSGWRRGHGERDDGRYDTPRAIFGACAGAAVYRRAALEAVGEFDATFFAFMEDVDWALRAQLAGWTCRYVPSAVAYHMGSATLGRRHDRLQPLSPAPQPRVADCQGLPRGSAARHAPRIAYVQAAELTSPARPAAWAYGFGRCATPYAACPAALRRRRAVQATRRVGVRELEAIVRADRSCSG